jgi:type IV secretory pathway TrbL component
MSKTLASLLTITALSLLSAGALADTTSSASSAASNIVGSLSDSLTGSSNSSSGDKKVAQGTYRIEQMAEVAGKPGRVRLELQALATAGAAGRVQLELPRVTVEAQALAVRGTIELREREFGMEVAHADTRTAFFLLLADGWRRDMETRPVTL